jgi:hypothetical protein
MVHLTPQAEAIVQRSGIVDGLCFVSPMHITARPQPFVACAGPHPVADPGGYPVPHAPNLWYGYSLSAGAASIALVDSGGALSLRAPRMTPLEGEPRP